MVNLRLMCAIRSDGPTADIFRGRRSREAKGSKERKHLLKCHFLLRLERKLDLEKKPALLPQLAHIVLTFCLEAKRREGKFEDGILVFSYAAHATTFFCTRKFPPSKMNHWVELLLRQNFIYFFSDDESFLKLHEFMIRWTLSVPQWEQAISNVQSVYLK